MVREEEEEEEKRHTHPIIEIKLTKKEKHCLSESSLSSFLNFSLIFASAVQCFNWHLSRSSENTKIHKTNMKTEIKTKIKKKKIKFYKILICWAFSSNPRSIRFYSLLFLVLPASPIYPMSVCLFLALKKTKEFSYCSLSKYILPFHPHSFRAS
ncbi:hypothetical protein PP707_08105 [Acetobacter pasteurianus]|nr:hypothetical protein [Acetobacter pasteurianus]